MKISEEHDTIFTEQQKYPKLVRPQNMCRYVSILTILCLTTFHCGYCLSYTTALGTSNIAIVYGQVTKKPIVKGFMIASLSFGVAFGTFLNPWILPKTTRRNMTLILCIVAFLIQPILQIRSLVVLFVIRFLQGVVTGLLLELIPLYVKQLSPKQINKRGVFGIYGQLFVIIGFMVVFGVNNIMLDSDTNQIVRWRIVVSFNLIAILVIIGAILIKLIPESPNSLIERGQIEEAKRVIGLFHKQNSIEEVYQQKLIELKQMKNPISPLNLDRSSLYTILAFELPIMHQMTGVSALISQMGFVTARFHSKFAEYVPFMMGSIQVLTTLYALIYFTKVKRKSLVIAGNLGMSLCCICLGVMYEVAKDTPQAFWGMVALVVVYMGINGATLVPGVWTYIPQIATKPEMRWSKVTSWLTGGVSVVVFVYIGQQFNYGEMFLTYGVFTMVCFVFNAYMMVKIKPKTKHVINVELRKLQLNTNSGQGQVQYGKQYYDRSFA